MDQVSRVDEDVYQPERNYGGEQDADLYLHIRALSAMGPWTAAADWLSRLFEQCRLGYERICSNASCGHIAHMRSDITGAAR